MPLSSVNSYTVMLSIFIGLTVLIFDLYTPQGVAGGVPYIALVLVGLLDSNSVLVMLLAVISSVLVVTGHVFTEPGLEMHSAMINRGLALFAIWCTAIVSYLHLRALEHLEPLANTDPLTGLHNRHSLDEKLNTLIEYYQRYRQPLSLILFDIDYFKQVNDNNGHVAGDRVLQLVAQRCEHAVRKIDTVARVGGEEFAILMPNTDSGGALDMAERLRLLIGERGFDYDGRELHLSASFGVAQLRDETWDAEDFFKAADDALYRAKKSGRNRSVVY